MTLRASNKYTFDFIHKIYVIYYKQSILYNVHIIKKYDLKIFLFGFDSLQVFINVFKEIVKGSYNKLCDDLLDDK